MKKDFLHEDTIVALATPIGCSAIAVIRISGKESLDIISKISKKSFFAKKTHSITFTEIFEENNVIDEVLVSVFIGEKSFTKEDSIEISCHGSVYIINKIIDLILSQGARLAQPGEFTQRAFINGRFDLVQAEAIADLIHSEDEKMHKIAISQLRGGFAENLKKLRNELKNIGALMELELDFSEEDVTFANRNELKNLLEKTRDHIQGLIDSYRSGKAIKEGVSIAIIGEPNVGKSTLLNTLLSYERAITSSIPGTTRDTLEEVFYIAGIKCRVIDTAGIRETSDEIEQLGIERSLSAAKDADIVLYIADIVNASKEELDSEIDSLSKIISGTLIKIVNKVDLTEADIINYYSGMGFLPISAKDTKSVIKLEEFLGRVLSQFDASSSVVSNLRHIDCLNKCKESTIKALEKMNGNIPTDIIMQEIRFTLFHIGELTGEIHSNDLLDIIFSKFCIGK